jgi:enamine deaminase RidA (YjgF/YER057c/UK114 family)
VGWNPATCRFDSDSFAGQTRQALHNVVEILLAAGARPHDLVRLTWYVTDRAEYVAARKEIGAAYREIIGGHYPPMSLVFVSGLLVVNLLWNQWHRRGVRGVQREVVQLAGDFGDDRSALRLRKRARALFRIVDDLLDVDDDRCGRNRGCGRSRGDFYIGRRLGSFRLGGRSWSELERLDERRVIAEFLQDLDSSFEALAIQNEIDFVVEPDPELPSTVQGDSDRLNEVVGNLLSNAFKFTPRGGRITLSASPARVIAVVPVARPREKHTAEELAALRIEIAKTLSHA